MGNKILGSDAYKRLEAILEYSDMGSGYKIAMRDLEIRGAGNVLGPEQHGHMAKVGYALYMSLLNQAITEVKSSKELIEKIDTKIDTMIPAYMPDDYVVDSNSKTAVYNMISGISNTNELVDVASKLKEAYGEILTPLSNLMKVALIKNMATTLYIKKIYIARDKATLEFHTTKELLTDNISQALEVYKKYAVLDLSNLPIIEIKGVDDNKMLDIIIEFLNYII
jgi:transcription-repair coupling factor (superfamily II helicase)